MKHGLFVGLLTLDFIYLAESPPQENQKIVASDYTVAAGGPATNAAVTFSYLGNFAKILGIVGSHPITGLIRGDLDAYGVAIADLEPNHVYPPPVSSIIVTQSSGDRAVISLNAAKTPANTTTIPANILENIDIILIDGHQMVVSQEMAIMAKNQGIPIVIDGGSWKPGFENILPYVDYAICSANFHPPHCHTEQDVYNYLQTFPIPHIAITHGEKPITYSHHGQISQIDICPTPTIDTLGAGDIFHGAFCHYILQENFPNALASASKIAALSCQYFGTRQWMQHSGDG
ncbi:ribokinase [Calothrix sp. 336/3]|nr:sugar kinase [Calothrix sp. 336/3]AKG23442.1 ribokinase [Calothrix sp. 336/3]